MTRAILTHGKVPVSNIFVPALFAQVLIKQGITAIRVCEKHKYLTYKGGYCALNVDIPVNKIAKDYPPFYQ